MPNRVMGLIKYVEEENIDDEVSQLVDAWTLVTILKCKGGFLNRKNSLIYRIMIYMGHDVYVPPLLYFCKAFQ